MTEFKPGDPVRVTFEGVVRRANLWSLAGSGKRCECGAIHSGRPGTPIAVTTRNAK